MENYSYDYSYSSLDSTTTAPDAALMAGLFIVFFLVGLALYAFSAFLLMRIFKKAGTPSWIAWVPFYNNWKILELGGQQGLWAVLALIPIVNIVSAVFFYIAMYNIGLKLGKSGAFVVLGIFLPLVWYIWLAFDHSVWDESAGAPSVAGNVPPTTPAAPTTPPTAQPTV